MSIPAVNFQFARAPGIIDPRATFTRATTAMRMGPNGYLQQVAANIPRFEYDPLTRRCLGYLCEQQRTNRWLRSQEFDNASWTKTGVTVTANSVAAPDGTTTADTLTATASGASVAQAATITAGTGAAISFYLKAGASAFAKLALTDGGNTAAVWVNLASGATGTQQAGGGNCVLSQVVVEAMGRGWYRASLEVTTATVTTLTGSVMPCAADGADSANGNSLYAWGAQFEADATYTSPSSYIPTTTATVTRNADNLFMPVSSSWFHDQEGSLVASVINRIVPPSNSGNSGPHYGGFGDTGAFQDIIYMGRSGPSSVYGVLSSSAGGSGAAPTRSTSWTPGARKRVGMSWALNDVSFTVDGGVVVTDDSQVMPVAANLHRMGVGAGAWGTGLSANTLGRCIFEAWQYFPRCLSDADLQAFTAL